MPKFKGGNITLKSGGIGPDDYVFKVLPHGRYYKVILPTNQGRDLYEANKAAMIYVLRNRTERLCLSDAQAVFNRRPSMQVLDFWTFSNRFGKGDFRKQYPELLKEAKR